MPGGCSLLEGKASISVGLEDLFDRVDVRSRTQIETEVVLHGGLHDGTGRTLHGVVQTGVDDVLLRGTGNALLECFRWGDGDLTADVAEASLQRGLHRLCTD